MEKYSEYHIETDGFEKVLIGMLHMVQMVPLGTKCRIVLDYDPALPKVTIETFIDKSDMERALERKPQKTLLVYPNEQLAREESEKRVTEMTMERPDYEFSDEDFSRAEDIDPATAEKMLWAFEQDNETGFVIVVPMNGEKLVIHGKQEAEMFCQFLIECFQ